MAQNEMTYGEALTLFENTTAEITAGFTKHNVKFDPLFTLPIPYQGRKKIFVDYLQAAEDDEEPDTIAMYYVAVCYFSSFGVDEDWNNGFLWLKKSAMAGQVKAQYSLAFIYKLGYGGVKKDSIEAFTWFSKAANIGDLESQYWLGMSYITGDLMERNPEKAFFWFFRAAERGDIKSQANVGWCYLNGEGVSRDVKKAVEWFSKAAAAGDVNSYYYMGFCCEHGFKDNKINLREAREWYKKAATLEDVNAQRALGRLSSWNPLTLLKWKLNRYYNRRYYISTAV